MSKYYRSGLLRLVTAIAEGAQTHREVLAISEIKSTSHSAYLLRKAQELGLAGYEPKISRTIHRGDKLASWTGKDGRKCVGIVTVIQDLA